MTRFASSAWAPKALDSVPSNLDYRRTVSRHPVDARAVAAALLLCCAALGCQNKECEASRLQLTGVWETLRNTAASRKQIPESSDLSKSEEDERIRVWTEIEAEAELMRSSFETSQVTWNSADKARAQLSQLFKPLAANDDPMTRGFATTLADADRRMEDFRKSCR